MLAEMQHIIDEGSPQTDDLDQDLQGDLNSMEEMYFTGISSTGPNPHVVPDLATEALSSPDKDKWQGALTDELQSLIKNNVYDVVPTPKNIKPLTSKIVM